MKLINLMSLVSEGWPATLDGFFDPETGEPIHFSIDEPGDGLARFVVRDVAENYDPELPDEELVSKISNILEYAAKDIAAVADHIVNPDHPKTLRIKVDLLVDYYGGDSVKEAADTVDKINTLLQQQNWPDSPQLGFNLDGKGQVMIEDL